MIIKICGITTLEAARAAQAAGTDWIGFVFAPSRRRIAVPAAQQISREVNKVAKVGVFVDAPLSEVLETAAACQLDYIQLHGNESAEYCERIPYPVIKAIRVTAATDFDKIANYPAAYILLDSFVAGQMGGTGETFDWQAAAQACGPIASRLIAAGGLHAGNVGQAIQLLQPQGVDVSGGVEINGLKDNAKIQCFIRAAREAERKSK